MYKWTRPEDEKPKEAEFVLVWGSHAVPWFAQCRLGKFRDVEDGEILLGITHWKRPEPPDDDKVCPKADVVDDNYTIWKARLNGRQLVLKTSVR